MMGKIIKTFFATIVSMMLVACGDNGNFFTAGTSNSTNTAGVLTLLVSSPQLGSSGSNATVVTALVKDSSNRLLPDIDVTFSASSGSINTTQGTTDASGKATALLDPGSDKSNRTITVTATTGTASQSTTVDVTGTNISVSGDTSIVLNASLDLVITLKDSDGKAISNEAITATSSLGNTITATNGSLNTDANGQVTITVAATTSGSDTLTFSGLGVSTTHILVISGDNFQLTAPVINSDIPLNTNQAVSLHWEQNGVPQAGQTVNFSATRGVLSATSGVTDANGDITLQISSNNAGPSTITASVTGGPSASRSINFVATTAAQINLQVDKATIGPNDGSQATQQQATLTATVRDANNNLVKGKQVTFSIIQDNSSGGLTTSTAITDNLGKASTTYVSSSATTAQGGVLIRASVTEGATIIPATVTMTVARSALFVRLGTGNLVAAPTQSQYAKEYSVIVTDASGNAVPNVDVNIAITPHSFAKGFWAWNGINLWTKAFIITGNPVTTCANEDVNLNGILDTGEDINGNLVLDPGNIVSAPNTVTTGADGSAVFDLIYAKEYATWVTVNLKASRTVAGTEASHTVQLTLPISGTDVGTEASPPPGVISPFGKGLQSAGNNVCTNTL